ncbi:putative RNA-directed DNA polymerase from transposon X-element [Colletotrichum tropicale]|nr:putative RNA-directed DNA polymerase from transposon X-element [Colletotrichum tropicale]
MRLIQNGTVGWALRAGRAVPHLPQGPATRVPPTVQPNGNVFSASSRHRWQEVARAAWRAEVGPKLKGIESLPLNTETDLDRFFAEADKILQNGRDKLVPRSRPPDISTRVRPSDPADRAPGKTNKFQDQENRNDNREASSRKNKAPGAAATPQSAPNNPESSPTETRHQRTKNWRMYLADRKKCIHKLACLAIRLAEASPKTDIPDFEEHGKYYQTVDEKAELLVRKLWPDSSEATGQPPGLELPDLSGEINSEDTALMDLKPRELADTVRRMPAHKAEGKSGISIDALKMLLPSKDDDEDLLTNVFERPLQACLKLCYHPNRFKEAITVMIAKSHKDPKLPTSYRPIALLCPIAKILEKLFAVRLTRWLLNSGVLPFEQYGCQGRNTTQALESLINAAYNSWTDGDKDRHVSIYALDIKGAFDRVRRAHLLRILREYGVPDWMIMFVWSFLSDRSTTVRMQGAVSKKFWVNIGIPQGSPLSPILFLFFSIPLLNKLIKDKGLVSNENAVLYQLKRFLIAAFVDDITFLIVSDSVEKNNKAAEKLYNALVDFAKKDGTTFSADKTKVIHLCKARQKFNDSMPNIEDAPPKAEKAIKILGLWLDYRLTWETHVTKIVNKARLKMFNLRRISGSTFGPGLKKLLARYTSAILPIISYACPVWFAGYDERKYTESGKPPGARCRFSISAKLVNRLESEHNYFLKQLSGAYAMTTGFILLKELAVPTIAVYLTRLVRTYWAQVLETRYEGKLLKPSGDYPDQHPYVLAATDAHSKVLQPAKERLELGKPVDEGARYRKLRRLIKSIADDLVTDQMQTDWGVFVDIRSCENRYFNKLPPALRGTWGKHNFKIYEDLLKAQSTILLHCRTGVNGLNACLNFMSFKLAPSSACPCGARPHDARHLFMECPLLAAPRKHLKAAMHVFCFHVLVTDYPELAANFAIRYFSLEQFAWTAKRLANPDFGNLPTGGS